MAEKAMSRQTTQPEKELLFDFILAKLDGRAYEIVTSLHTSLAQLQKGPRTYKKPRELIGL